MKKLLAALLFVASSVSTVMAQQPNSDLENYAKMLEAYRQGDAFQLAILNKQIDKLNAQVKADAADLAAAKKQCAPQPKKEHQRP